MSILTKTETELLITVLGFTVAVVGELAEIDGSEEKLEDAKRLLTMSTAIATIIEKLDETGWKYTQAVTAAEAQGNG